jgi:hypothetical protein
MRIQTILRLLITGLSALHPGSKNSMEKFYFERNLDAEWFFL